MEDEKCYIFKPVESKDVSKKSTKRAGAATTIAVRKQIYRALWEQQSDRFDNVQQSADSETLNEILQYIDSITEFTNKIPTALVNTTAGLASQAGLFEQLQLAIDARSEYNFVVISPHDATSLKNLLRTIIQKATRIVDTDEELSSYSNGTSKLLNYDFQILQNFCNAREIKRTIITIPESEAFDVHVLTDFLKLLQSYVDRVPLFLIFGISTSIDMFHERLPRSAIGIMYGKSFEAAKTHEVIEEMFETIVEDVNVRLRPGPTIIELILQRQQDHISSIDAFRCAWQYSMMCHFYGNPLSILLKEGIAFEDLNPTIFESIRNLPSFQRSVDDLVEEKHTKLVTELLQNDKALYDWVVLRIEESRNQIQWALGSLRVIQLLRNRFSNKTSIPISTVYSQVLSASGVDGNLVRESLLVAKKLSPEDLFLLLSEIMDILIVMPPGLDVSPDDFRDLSGEVEGFMHGDKAANEPEDSEADLRQRPSRNKSYTRKKDVVPGLAQLPQRNPALTRLLSKFHDLTGDYLRKAIVAIKDIPFNEILFYDLKSPYRDVFLPKPKLVIERALASPHDYLACSCCGNNQALSNTQPPSAILYQLYLESGALINAYDLWSAFRIIIGESDQDDDDKQVMALFYRGLAELKQLGMIKMSRKKVDHLAKLAWRGL